MRIALALDLPAFSRIPGGGDVALADTLLAATDDAIRSRLDGLEANGVDSAAALRAVVAGDLATLPEGAAQQAFDLFAVHVGEEIGFLDETWASDKVLTAIDKAKVNIDRGGDAPLPWPLERSSTGIPMIQVWSTADLATLADELDTARAKVAPGLVDDVATVAAKVRDLRDGGRAVVVIDWL